MKKYFLLFILFIFFSCQNTSIKEEEKINDVKTKISVSDDNTENIYCYHLYFENINEKSMSFGKNIFDKNFDLSYDLFPGVYNIYCYGIADKTETSKKAVSYYKDLNKEIFNNTELSFQMKQLIPEFSISKSENNVELTIYLTDYYDIFSLSSISVKQNAQKYKSVDFERNSLDKICVSNIEITELGDWYMNISYSIKSKVDKDVLASDNIYISTNYISDVYLGNLID